MSIAAVTIFLIFFILAGLVDWLPFLTLTKNVTQLGANAVNTIRSSSLADKEKEKLLLANALNMLVQSLKILGLILLIVGIGLLLLLVVSLLFKSENFQKLIQYTISISGLLISVGSFFAWFILKKLYVKVRL